MMSRHNRYDLNQGRFLASRREWVAEIKNLDERRRD
jgi:hypothetical protein